MIQTNVVVWLLIGVFFVGFAVGVLVGGLIGLNKLLKDKSRGEWTWNETRAGTIRDHVN